MIQIIVNSTHIPGTIVTVVEGACNPRAVTGGIEGVQVTTYAFQTGLPFPNQVAAFILMICLVFFAFTTILGWDYYSERRLEYLTGGKT